MEKKKFYVEVATPAVDQPIYLLVKAYIIGHALQVAEAWIGGSGKPYSVSEIRQEAKRGAKYEVEL